MKKLLHILCLLAFCTPSVSTAQNCQDYTCNIAKARTALTNKKFKDAIDYCKAAKAYPNANISEADALIYKIFEGIEAQKKIAEQAEDAARKAEKSAISAKNEAKSEAENAKREKEKSDKRATLMRFISLANKKAAKECTIENFDEVERVWKEASDSLPNFSELPREKIVFLLGYYENPSRTNVKKIIQDVLETAFTQGIKQTKGTEQKYFYKERATFLDKLNRLDESDKDLDIVYADSTKSTKGLYHISRAVKHLGLENNKTALEHINQAIIYLPNHAEAYILRGDIDTSYKLAGIKKAIDLTTDKVVKARYYENKAVYYEKNNQFDLAVEAYFDALDLTEDDADAANRRKKLAAVYTKMGQADKAKEQNVLVSTQSNIPVIAAGANVKNVNQYETLIDSLLTHSKTFNAKTASSYQYQLEKKQLLIAYLIAEKSKNKKVPPSLLQLLKQTEDNLKKQFVLPTDPLLGQQWTFKNTGKIPDNPAIKLKQGADGKIIEAWQAMSSLGATNVTVAVIDNGFDITHPDLVNPYKPWNLWTQSPQLAANDPTYTNGTSCASVAVAKANGIGMVGVSPNARFMPVSGTGFSIESTEGMFNYCTTYGADVISCSWGTGDKNFKLNAEKNEIIARAARTGRDGKGIVICFAAGNEGEDNVNVYGAHPDVICVGASTSEDEHADYSNKGVEISVCAPSNGGQFPVLAARASWDEGYQGDVGASKWYSGDGIDRGDKYKHFGGTSAATPFVAGVCALILSENPLLTAKEVKQILEQTADKIGSPSEYTKGHSLKYGYGRVNALKAVTEARKRLLDYLSN